MNFIGETKNFKVWNVELGHFVPFSEKVTCKVKPCHAIFSSFQSVFSPYVTTHPLPLRIIYSPILRA